MYKRHETGKNGEDMACDYIEKLGYEIIERNYRNKLGEIDIIAKDKNELVFIEVKTRCQRNYGRPSEAVDIKKKKHIYHVAEIYLIKHKIENVFCRIDVIEIYIKNEKTSINHIKNSIQEQPIKNNFQMYDEDYEIDLEFGE